MRIVRNSILIVLALSASWEGTSAQRLKYTVDIRETATHKVHVTLVTEKLTPRSTVTFQMPVWAPGAYSVSHYGRYLTQFTAQDKKGKKLEVKQINSDRWEIEHAKSLRTITYDVLDSHKDSTSLYFAMANMDSMLFFANATALFGYVNDRKDIPATVTYLKPDNWQLATALDPATIVGSPEQVGRFRHTTFSARNYDVLVDAPVMAAPQFQARSFREGSADYDVVAVSNRPFAIDSLTAYVRPIVRTETQFFHDTPFSHYTFLVYAPTLQRLPSFAQGALEHANSSDYMLVNLPWSTFKTFGVSTFSHEFFHLWNVKRIHSSLLGPFDYTQRVKTTSLWLAEGITDYYAHSLLTRGHIVPKWNFYDDVKNWENSFANASPSARNESLEELSIAESDFSMDNAEIFYIKGPLVGLMLDIEIRSRTNNSKSLDDVMFALNANAKEGKTFKDADLIGLMGKITGLDLTDFYKHYIAGTDSLPIDSYLARIGVVPDTGESSGGEQKMSIGVGSSGNIVIQSIEPGSAMEKAGLKSGDELVAVDGTPLSIQTLDKLTDLQDNATAKLDIIREGKPMTVVADLQAARERASSNPHHAFKIAPGSTPLMDAMRRGIVEQL